MKWNLICQDFINDELVSKQEGNYVVKHLTRDSFAGSVATMDHLARDIVSLMGISIQDAIKIATLNPDRVLGIDADRGILFLGLKVDVVVFDKNVKIIMTVVEGKIVYRRKINDIKR